MRAAAACTAVALGVGLVGCTSGSPTPGSELRVSVPQAVLSYNAQTVLGQELSQSEIPSATRGGFWQADPGFELVANPDFGSVTIEKTDPLTVTYEISSGAKWSDGESVAVADLLLAWAGMSHALNDDGFKRSDLIDPESGLAAPAFGEKTVFFDGVANGLESVTSIPSLGENGRSLTMVFDRPVADIRHIFDVGVSAHSVGMAAFDSSSAQDAAEEVRDAIAQNDRAALAPISRVWSTGFVASSMTDARLLASVGPYAVTALGSSTELSANANNRGGLPRTTEKIIVESGRDLTSIADAIGSGDLDAAVVPDSAFVGEGFSGDGSTKAGQSGVSAVRTFVSPNAEIAIGLGGSFEHLDLQFTNSANGAFDSAEVRQAFLLTVPREQIVRKVLGEFDTSAAPRKSFLAAPGRTDYDALVSAGASGSYSGSGSDENLEKARQLLEAHQTPAPTVCVLFEAGNAQRIAEFELIRDSAARAGFVVTDCSRSDWTEYLGVPGAYDAALFAWDSTTALAAVQARYGSLPAVANMSFYSNTVVDALIDRTLREALDADLSADSYSDATLATLSAVEKQLWADSFGMPLFEHPSIVISTKGVAGLEWVLG